MGRLHIGGLREAFRVVLSGDNRSCQVGLMDDPANPSRGELGNFLRAAASAHPLRWVSSGDGDGERRPAPPMEVGARLHWCRLVYPAGSRVRDVKRSLPSPRSMRWHERATGAAEHVIFAP